MTKAVQYNAGITLRAEPEIIAQIHAAAKKRRTKPSQWIRDAVNLALEIENQGNDR